jgi:hypothetical protein
MKPLLSVCIPVYKPNDLFFELLTSFSKNIDVSYELVILETIERLQDKTVKSQIATMFPGVPMTHKTIQKSAFNHGSARNELTEMSQGEWMLFTTQDVSVHTWHSFRVTLDRLSKEKIDAACAIHKPRGNAFKFLFQKMFAELLATNLNALLPSEFPWWSNNFALYTRNSLTLNPFLDFGFGEDLVWARIARSMNFNLIITDSFEIIHTNKDTFRAAFERGLLEGFSLHKSNYYPGLPNYSGLNLRPIFYRTWVLIKHEIRIISLKQFFMAIKFYACDLVQTLGKILGFYKEAKIKKNLVLNV